MMESSTRDDSEVLGEVVQAYRHRYARIFKERWGGKPAALRTPRFALLHDGSAGDGVTAQLLELLTSQGSSVEAFSLSSDELQIFREIGYDAVLVSLTDLPAEETFGTLRPHIRRVIEDATLVVGVGKGVALLAQEGFLKGRKVAIAPAETEWISRHNVLSAEGTFVQDGCFLTCAGREGAPELVETLLDQLR